MNVLRLIIAAILAGVIVAPANASAPKQRPASIVVALVRGPADAKTCVRGGKIVFQTRGGKKVCVTREDLRYYLCDDPVFIHFRAICKGKALITPH